MGGPATTPAERYEELDLKLSLTRSNQYVEGCNELSFFLRHAYSRSPKNLQSLIFEDVLSAFRLLPQMQMQNAIFANILLQRAESALPKQKRVLAVTEFKHGMVACKRRGKAQHEEEGLSYLPEDILTIIFSFLDLRSLASAAMVCRSWSVTASENHLWESLYFSFFGNSDEGMRVDERKSCGMIKYEKDIQPQMNMATGSNMINWRSNFKRFYIRSSSKEFAPYRGYCRNCNLIVWLDDARCYSRHTKKNCGKPEVIPVSMFQIVDFVLYDSLTLESSSESDSDSDDWSILEFWCQY